MQSKSEKTKQFIIEKAAPIFNTKGYAGTSLSDIIESTKLTKGAIYGNFENKDEIAVEVYKYHIRSLNSRINEFLSNCNTPPEKLKGITEYYRVNWKRIFAHGGCPILNAAIEADDDASCLRRNVQSSLARWAQNIAGIIKEGQDERYFRKRINAEEYAFSIITLLEGGMMMGKIMNDHKHLFAVLDRIDGMIDNELRK
jgi:AcrR family transcriptional regulator